jgi:tetratricopeptide (TPR) repeat protein
MRVSPVGVITVLVTMGCAVFPPARAASTDAAAAMRAGIRDFEAGAFQQALDKFLDARSQGMDSPALHYDLGSTYYKLGRDAEAATEFRSLLSDPKFGDFARYNLGLTARRAGHKSEANEYFSQVAAQAHDTHLQALARAELRGHSRGGPHGWQGFVEASGGYDDNVALASRNALLTASGAGSKVYSAMAGGGGWLTGGHNRGLRLTGNVYDVQYPDQSAFNLLIAQGGPEYFLPLSSWRLRAAAYAARINLGGNALETFGAFNLRGEHSIGRGRLRLDYRLERITGGPRYAYLSGWQNQLGVRTSWRPGPVGIMFGYSLTVNNRQDLASGAQFFSVSPVRNQVETELRWNATLRSTFYARGYYWWSVYRDRNVFLQGGALQDKRRVDNGRGAEVGLIYRLTENVRLTAEYGLRNNNSNITRYTYTSNRYTVSLQYVF